MTRSKKMLLLPALALTCASALAGCKTTGLHLKEQYPADRLIVAESRGPTVTDVPLLATEAEREEAPARSSSIDQLLCEHGFAAHHPYRYLNNCARSGRI